MRLSRKVKVSLVSLGLLVLIIWVVSLISTGAGQCYVITFSDTGDPTPLLWIPWYPLAALACVGIIAAIVWAVVKIPPMFARWIWGLASELVDEWENRK